MTIHMYIENAIIVHAIYECGDSEETFRFPCMCVCVCLRAGVLNRFFISIWSQIRIPTLSHSRSIPFFPSDRLKQQLQFCCTRKKMEKYPLFSAGSPEDLLFSFWLDAILKLHMRFKLNTYANAFVTIIIWHALSVWFDECWVLRPVTTIWLKYTYAMSFSQWHTSFFYSFIRYSVMYKSVINTPPSMFDNRQEFFQHSLIIFDNVWKKICSVFVRWGRVAKLITRISANSQCVFINIIKNKKN